MKQIHFYQQSEQGRSMVEMLGTLAIMGVLSAGAIGGYSYAMNKHRTNELIYEATKRAQWVGTQLELNNSAPSLNTFGNDSFGGGSFTGEVKTGLANPNQFGIAVSELKEGVCKNIIKGLEAETNGVVRAVKTTDGSADFDQDNCADNAEFLLVFNRDLSTSDSEVPSVEPEVSGEVSAQASTEAPATQNPDEVHCNGNGSWNGSSCYCDNGWQGDNCSEEEPEETTTAQSGDAECNYHGTWSGSGCSCQSGWGGSDCSEDHICSGHGVWIVSTDNANGGYCSCESSWGGSDCSEDHTNDCSGHGTWYQSSENGDGGCECNSGWGGSDCSKCSGHGSWSQWMNSGAGGCSCNSGWGGSDCSEEEQNDSPSTATATEYEPEATA